MQFQLWVRLQDRSQLLGLMRGKIVDYDVNLLLDLNTPTVCPRKSTNCSLMWRAAVSSCTFPVLTSSAAPGACPRAYFTRFDPGSPARIVEHC
jgi:hypothetical protein